MDIAGNTILITGGGSGIGRALAEALHARGNRVLVTGRRAGPLQAVAAANPGMAWATLDMTDAGAIRAFAEQVARDWPDLNVLINNAGIMVAEDLNAEPFDPAIAEATVATNLLGPIRLTTALLPQLKRQPASPVMTVTSGLDVGGGAGAGAAGRGHGPDAGPRGEPELHAAGGLYGGGYGADRTGRDPARRDLGGAGQAAAFRGDRGPLRAGLRHAEPRPLTHRRAVERPPALPRPHSPPSYAAAHHAMSGALQRVRVLPDLSVEAPGSSRSSVVTSRGTTPYPAPEGAGCARRSGEFRSCAPPHMKDDRDHRDL